MSSQKFSDVTRCGEFASRVPKLHFPSPSPLPLLQLSFNIKHAINARFSFRKNVKNLQHKKRGKQKTTAQCRNAFFSCPNCLGTQRSVAHKLYSEYFYCFQHKVKELRVPSEGRGAGGAVRGIFTSVNNPSTEGGGSRSRHGLLPREKSVCMFCILPE